MKHMTIDDMVKIAYDSSIQSGRLQTEISFCEDDVLEEIRAKVKGEATSLRFENVPKCKHKGENDSNSEEECIKIRCCELVRLNNLEFINECYRAILGREADLLGKKDWLDQLNTGITSKIEMIYYIAESEEAKCRNIAVVDGKKEYRLRRLLKRMYRIPVAGKLMYLFSRAIRFNRMIWDMQRRDSKYEIDVESMTDQIEELREENSKLKLGIESMINQIEELNEKLEERKNDPYKCIDYFSFENHFRGKRERIKEVQKIYLPYFINAKGPVIDFGCGRGEFLEIMRDNEIEAIGVETYSKFVEYDRSLGLNVIEEDGLSYLKSCDSIGGIFAGQVLEHLQISEMLELCRLAFERLEKGGYLVMETPNPTSLAIFTESFYIDPSHYKPVHPQFIRYLLEMVGFKKIDFIFTVSSRLPYRIPIKEEIIENGGYNQAISQANEMLFGSQDYAVIAQK